MVFSLQPANTKSADPRTTNRLRVRFFTVVILPYSPLKLYGAEIFPVFLRKYRGDIFERLFMIHLQPSFPFFKVLAMQEGFRQPTPEEAQKQLLEPLPAGAFISATTIKSEATQKEYTILDVYVGSGGFGLVTRVLGPNGEQLVVKQVPIGHEYTFTLPDKTEKTLRATAMENIQREVAILKMMREKFPNAPFREALFSEANQMAYIFMEECIFGNLNKASTDIWIDNKYGDLIPIAFDFTKERIKQKYDLDISEMGLTVENLANTPIEELAPALEDYIWDKKPDLKNDREIIIMDIYNHFLSISNYTPMTTSLIPQIIEQLFYLHTLGILNRDIKSENIFIDRQGKAWVMDFGLSKSIESIRTEKDVNTVGSPDCIPPDLAIMVLTLYLDDIKDTQLKEQAITQIVESLSSTKMDSWALGALIHEMVTESTLFSSYTSEEDQALMKAKMKNGPTLPHKNTPLETFRVEHPDPQNPMIQEGAPGKYYDVSTMSALNFLYFKIAYLQNPQPTETLESFSLEYATCKLLTHNSDDRWSVTDFKNYLLKHQNEPTAKLSEDAWAYTVSRLQIFPN
jgi:hypothetical protein